MPASQAGRPRFDPGRPLHSALACPRMIGLRRRPVLVDAMVSGIDEQYPVGPVGYDSGRFARRDAYGVMAGVLAAIEVRHLMLLQLELANRAVVGVGDQDAVAIDGDPKRMLQARGGKIAVNPSEVEQPFADQRHNLWTIR